MVVFFYYGPGLVNNIWFFINSLIVLNHTAMKHLYGGKGRLGNTLVFLVSAVICIIESVFFVLNILHFFDVMYFQGLGLSFGMKLCNVLLRLPARDFCYSTLSELPLFDYSGVFIWFSFLSYSLIISIKCVIKAFSIFKHTVYPALPSSDVVTDGCKQIHAKVSSL
eukprot:UN01158